MANVITSFLVGIGLDVSEFEKGEKRVQTSMEGIRSSTLAIGSAMASAAIGAGVRVDQLAEKSRKLQDQLYRTNTQTTWAQGYGVALRELGGNADDAVGRITGLEERLAAIRMGDRSFVDTLGPAGFDAGQLSQAKSAQEFITMAADQFSRATHTQQVNMANVLGLTDAEFKLWQQGGSYVTEHSNKLAEQIGYTESLNQKQYEYSQAWVGLNLELDKASNTLSNIMLPSMTNLVNLANEYTGAFTKFAQENPDETTAAVAGSSIAAAGFGLSSIGAIGAKLGIPGSRLLRAAGPVGTTAGISVAAEPWIDKGLNSVFGGSEYYQNLRTAPTWGEFGQALIGQRETTPEVKRYVESREPNFLDKTWDFLSQPSPMRQQNDRHMMEIDRNKTTSPTYEPERIYPLQPVQQPERIYPLQNPETSGDDYTPPSFMRDYNAVATGSETAQAMPPLRVDNNIKFTGKVEMDGRAMGEFVDTRIDEHNEQAVQQYSTRVSR